jgi:predicted DNA-binding transcriptional regulator AlpA
MPRNTPGATSSTAPPGHEPEAIAADAVARLYGCSVRHVIRAADRGEIPRGFRVGSLRRWSRRAILDDIAAKASAANGGPRDDRPGRN